MKYILIILIISFSIMKAEQNGMKPPRGYLNNTFLKWSAMLGWIDLVDTKPEIPQNIEVFNDLEFKKTEQRSLFLDIYRKKDNSNEYLPKKNRRAFKSMKMGKYFIKFPFHKKALLLILILSINALPFCMFSENSLVNFLEIFFDFPKNLIKKLNLISKIAFLSKSIP